MDFLERIFSLSPDGGSGATELLLLGVIVCALAAVVLHFRGTLQRNLIGVSLNSSLGPVEARATPRPPSVLLWLFEVARVLVRFNHIAHVIVNANHSIV